MSDLQDNILDILADQQFHSGESLGEQLGVSRTAVWQQLQKLEAIGFQLESVRLINTSEKRQMKQPILQR